LVKEKVIKIDSHCHIQFNAYKDDVDVVLQKCRERGVIMNCVGSQIDTSIRAVEYAEKYPDVYATVGLHPIHLFSTEVDEEETKFTSREEKFDYEAYKKLASHPKVIGIGECGLELFHLPPNADKKEILEKQHEGFLGQYKLAKELDLPLVIHVRDAHPEMIELLRSLVSPISSTVIPAQAGIQSPTTGSRILVRDDKSTAIKGVVHCYTGNWEYAQQYLDLGLYLGFTGVITFKPKKTNPKPQEEIWEVVVNCPMDRMLIETDAPYLAPQAYRGERCEPWMVVEVAKKIAEIKKMGLEEVVKITEQNTKKLFSKIK